MATLATVNRPASRASAGAGSGATRSRVRLASLDDVAVEIARTYRRAERGAIPIGDATRLVFILSSLGRVLEASVIERRLSNLEELADGLDETSRGP